MATATLFKQYTDYNDRLKSQGIKLISFNCPCCSKPIETMPAPEGDVWDSLSTCPHCDRMFMKITNGKNAEGVIPQA